MAPVIVPFVTLIVILLFLGLPLAALIAGVFLLGIVVTAELMRANWP